jgi:hypothetical protein
MNTTFEIGDAENLKLHLQNLRETLQGEWSTVVSSWQNLEASWNDLQRDKFEDAFQQLLADYQTIDRDSETHIQKLLQQIQIVQDQNDQLNALN